MNFENSENSEDNAENTSEEEREESLDSEKIEKFMKNMETPMAEENYKINASKVLWEKAFHDIYLEMYDFDSGYIKSRESFTRALLNVGSHESPTEIYKLLDSVTTRLQKIHVIKRICCFLGLHNEMDKIIEHEMNLMYRHPSVNIEPKHRSVMIAGDK